MTHSVPQNNRYLFATAQARRFLLLAWALLLSLGSAHAGLEPYRNAVLADNPIGYWELDEAAGTTTAADSSGSGRAGTYSNVTLGQTSAFPNLGTAGSFNGSNSRVVVPFHSSFNLGTGDYTVECWYRTAATTRGDIFNFKNSGDFGIFANVSGAGSIGGWHNGLLPYIVTTLSAWHHVVYVRSAGTITLYVDGVARGSQANTQAMSSNADIVIGANQMAAWFNGQIDEVAYYNTALSAARVQAHYTAAQVTPTTPAVTTGAATNVYASSATLEAIVTDTGNEPPVVTIFYGPTDGDTTAAAWANSVSLGARSGSATGIATGLTQASEYFFRARAVNSAGTAWAANTGSFTTPTPTAPTVQNLAPTNISGTSANLRGEVTVTGNEPPAITIYYGTTDGGTNPAAWASSLNVPGGQAGVFFQKASGLTPLTTYYYRCFAQNPGGSDWADTTQSFATPAFVAPTVVINELHINEDDATIHSEFIELYNAGATTVDLSGWFFDKGINFTIPNGTTLAAGAYLVLCEHPATMQSRYGVSGAGVISWQDGPTPKWSSLSNNGETVTLRDAGGNRVDEVTYGLGFPWPTVGDLPSKSMELIHPNLDNDLGGSWRSSNTGPTPRAVNSVFAANAPPAIRQVAHNAVAPVAGQTWMKTGQEVRITAKVTDPDDVQSVTLQYQIVEPGDYIKLDDVRYNAPASWTSLPMNDSGQNGDLLAADTIFSAVIPASAQTHRRLVRYRITVADSLGASVRVPYADDPQPNFAYFVHDVVPSWTGAANPGVTTPVTYSSPMLSNVQQYHLITRVEEHANAQYVPVPTAGGGTQNPTTGTYGHSDYLWKGALCYDGVVYDHIRYRARGGVWRFAMGKNMWKFDFNKGHDFEARDNYGRKYGQKWKKLNFSAAIQQGDFGSRGEQGLYESVGFRLFQLTGMPAENTQFVHFRIVERPNETNGTANQFDDDFQGLYLAIEQLDGQFLDEHDLPDGNLYKMEGGTGELNNQSPYLPSNKSDLNAFINYGTTEQWWRTNADLKNYYNYRAIVDCIHHYDIGDGKNYFYYHNPETSKWTALPWDLDLTWADNAYRADTGIAGLSPSNNPTEPFFSRVYGNGSTMPGIPALRNEHRNRMREVLDLLFNPEQTGMLIEELASIVYQPGQPSFVDADRAMWDRNPILVSGYVNANKAGHGRFYQSAVDNPGTPANEAQTFAGMIQRMKNYVVSRRNVITSQILTSTEENLVPTTPVITVTGGASTTVPTDQLTFSSTGFVGKNGATFSAMKWRIAEVTEPTAPGYNAFDRTKPRLFEADPANTWESPELTSFTGTYTFPPISARPGRTYRARVKHLDSTGRWSHWSAPVSFTASLPDINVYLESLVISQVMYNPAPPNANELVIAQSSESFEWVEVLNVGANPIDLTPLRFTKGIDFDFANGAVPTLEPGARVLVVSNLAAFNARYAGQLDGVQIAGEWESGDNLSNTGEQLKLSFAAGTAIRDFIYDDELPWPLAADAGHALVLINPTSLPDHTVATNWRASATLHGTPGFASADDPVSFTAHPQGATVNPGQPVPMSVTVTGTAPFTYQWRKDGEPILNATESSYTIGAATEDDEALYDVVVTNGAGSKESNIAIVNVNDPVVIIDHPAGRTVNPGQTVELSVTANGTGPFTYQWRKGGEPILNATANIYTIISATEDDEGSYDVVVSNVVGSQPSNAALVSVNDPVQLVVSPGDQTVNPGADITFSVAASGTGPFTYQWRKDGGNLEGETTESLVILGVTADHAGSYDVVVTGATGAATSGTVQLSLNQAVSIIGDPKPIAVELGGKAAFTVAVAGTAPFTYQWRKGGQAIEGATEAIYNIANVTSGDLANYDVVVSNVVNSATSAEAALSLVDWPANTGNYQGVLAGPDLNDPAAHPRPGRVTLKVAKTGKFTGSLEYLGVRHGFKGEFDASLEATVIADSKGFQPVTLHIWLDGVEHAVEVEAQKSTRTSEALLAKIPTRSKTAPALKMGRYTVLLEPGAGAPDNLTAPGYLTINVSKTGVAKWAGKLPDAGVLRGSAWLTADDQLAFYAPLYAKKEPFAGHVAGPLAIAGTDIAGGFGWRKPPQSKGSYWPAGFEALLAAEGGLHVKPAKNVRTINVPTLTLAITGPMPGGGLNAQVQLSEKNKFLVQGLNAEKVKLNYNPTTGLMKGSFFDSTLRKTRKLEGVLLQDEERAAGFFLGAERSGDWHLAAPAAEQ